MKPGFLEQTLDTRSSNGRDDLLLSELHFRDTNGNMFRVPVGSTTDGGSTPRLVWLIPGFEPTGKHWLEWVLHDSAYRGTLQIRHGVQYVAANLARKQADELLSRALQLRGMLPIARGAVHSTLRMFGWRSYKSSGGTEDRVNGLSRGERPAAGPNHDVNHYCGCGRHVPCRHCGEEIPP